MTFIILKQPLPDKIRRTQHSFKIVIFDLMNSVAIRMMRKAPRRIARNPARLVIPVSYR